MLRLFKKTVFSQKVFSKKQRVFFSLASLFLALFLPLFSNAEGLAPGVNPLYDVGVWVWQTFGRIGIQGLVKIGEIIINAGLQLILLIANAALAMSNLLFYGIIQKGGAITLSYTNPATNPIINIGWTLTRDLTNMLFILGLVYIGLATALRIGGFQTKKVFPVLLAVALLINFTPTICGVVVDISNLIMNFFLEGLTGGDAIGKIFREQLATFGGLFTQAPTLASVGKTIALTFFAITAAIVFFLFTFLFLARHVAIWLLVIISPFAFFAAIFPKSKRFFSIWWKQFLAWSFVGATGAFFLYLGQHILFAADTKEIDMGSVGSGIFSGMLNSLLPYTVPIIFLYAGYLLALKSGAMGADKVVGVAESVRGKMVGLGWQKAGRRLTGKLKQALGGKTKTEEEVAKEKGAMGWLAKKARYLGLRPETEKEKEAWEKASFGKKALRKLAKAGASIPLAGLPFWAQRAARYLGEFEAETARKEVSNAQAKVKGKSLDAQVNKLKSAIISDFDKIGALLAIIKDGNLEDAKDLKDLKDWEVKDILKKAIALYPAAAKEIGRAEPVLAGEVWDKHHDEFSESQLKQAGLLFTDEDRKKGFNHITEKLIARAKPSVIENQWTTETMKKAVALDNTHRFWQPNQWAAAGRKFGDAFFEVLSKYMKDAEWYKQNNPSGYRYFTSTAARSAGIGFTPEGEKMKPREKPGPGSTEEWEKQKRKWQNEEEKPKSPGPAEEGPAPEERGEAGLTE